jgi:uncharacterized membrane protein YheB (UPF0754 family)
LSTLEEALVDGVRELLASDTVTFWSIPVFTGVIGWMINASGLWMLFRPIQFHGYRVPGLAELANLLPRRFQEIPGIRQGKVGWQGIVPARAGKMGSISVDKVIAKLGTPAEFYQQLEPERIAEHIIRVFEPEVPAIVDEAMRRNKPLLWASVPQQAKRAVYARVGAELPGIIDDITFQIGEHIDQLLDPKIMVVDHLTAHPELINRIFRDIGTRELRLMVNFGFLFGFLFGIPVAVVDHSFHQWWLLPICGIAVGWATNLVGIWLIFEPVLPRRILGVRVHGVFLRRQDEVAEIYAGVIADDVVTMERIGDFLINGPRGDRTQQMLRDSLGPAIDNAAGVMLPAVRLVVGARQYSTIRDSVAVDSAQHTMKPFLDAGFSRSQSVNLRELFTRRVKEMPPRDFVEMLRAAIKEDEWMLYAHGAIMGFIGGLVHLAVFGV